MFATKDSMPRLSLRFHREHSARSKTILRLLVTAAALAASSLNSSAAAHTSLATTSSKGSTTDPLVVSPQGSNSGAGTTKDPVRTIGTAVSKAHFGQSILVRGGRYHESVTIPVGKTLHLRAYPGEEVTLDGSQIVSDFTASGNNWVAGNWTVEFDASPTHTHGSKDSSTAGWGFVNPQYPLAAHPDQVWIDGTAQRQVSSRGALRSGTFYVDYNTDRLYLGSNPAGKTVRSSDLVRGLAIRAANSSVEGIDVRRFAPSVPDMGAVTVECSGVSLQDMKITDNATTGLHVGGTDVELIGLDLERNGMLGVNTVYADRLLVRGMTSRGNNTEHFNSSPVSGGLKITRTRGAQVQDSLFDSNNGPGLWLDESVYDAEITRSKITNNAGHGVSLEISARVSMVDNILVGNGGHGIKVNNTSSVRLWNNTIVGPGRPVNIVQDTRRAADPSSPGHDKRRPIPDPTMSWINRDISVGNNILSSAGASGNCLFCVEDYSRTDSAEQMRVSSNGNLYHRPTAGSPRWSVVWSNGQQSPSVYTDLNVFASSESQERASYELIGGTVLTADHQVSTRVDDRESRVAQPLPVVLAQMAGVPTGTKRLGALHR